VSRVPAPASPRDSQAAIPLSRMTSERVDHRHGLMDAAHHSRETGAHARPPGRAWTTMPPPDTRSRPESSDRASETRPKTPGTTRRRKRLDTLPHLPDRSGMSRHGDPVRNRTGTASMKWRLSAAMPPGSDFLPAGMFPVRAYISSVGTVPAGFMMSPACSAHAAVPAVIGAGNGMETDGPQPECRQALEPVSHPFVTD